MSFISDVKISKKLPIMMVGFAFVTALVVGWLTISKATEQTLDGYEQKLIAMQASRTSALDNYLKSIQQDLGVLSTNQYVRSVLKDYISAWNEFGVNQTEYLQKKYIDENEHPLGSKHLLDVADDGTSYAAVHKKHHTWFRQFLTDKGYYDIFLFAPDGTIVYTVFKERDFATNVMRGEWKDTDIGNVFRMVKDNAKGGYQAFVDFKPYKPSADVPAAFVAAPILDDDGSFAGAIAFQMPIGRINEVMQISAGMGESGETYLVGADFLMRSDSRFLKTGETSILKTKVESDT